jgi:hypothetical protein
MRKVTAAVVAFLISAGVSVTVVPASQASVCEPDGTGCTKAGTYDGPDVVINSDFLGTKVVWTKSVVQPYSSGVPLYWTMYTTYTNITAASLTIECPGSWPDPGYVAEVMSGGSGDDGLVGAENTSCSANPGMLAPLAPGASLTLQATFHNVPWPGSSVAVQWGDAGTSAAVNPFSSTTPTPAPVAYNLAWNGYVHAGASWAVGAMIVVPHLKCPFIQSAGAGAAANPWVGLGGATKGSPLVQVGIQSKCVQFGIQENHLVWQQLPPDTNVNPILTKLAFAGDHVFLSVDYLGGTKFYLDATDTNRLSGWHWSKTIQEKAEKGVPQSSDWIVEAGGPPLADFGVAQFAGASYAPTRTGGGQYTDNGNAVRFIAGSARRPDTSVSDIGTGSSSGAFTVNYIRS